MQQEQISEMARAEGAHWYFRSRREVLRALIEALGLQGPVLDVGCGTGGNAELLRPWAPLHGIDRSLSAARGSLEAGYASALLADGHRLPFGDASFPMVTCLDVLEHLADDGTAAAELRRTCRPGGCVIVTVPAFQWLWSGHDVALGHRRRYTRGQVRTLLEGTGLRIRRLTYCLFGTFVPAAAIRTLQRAGRLGRPISSGVSTDVDGFPLPRPINDALAGLLAQEARWVARRDLPLGLSIFAAAERL